MKTELTKLERIVAHWLRRFRTTLNMTPADVASAAGIEQNTVENYEAEKEPVKLADLEPLSEVFYIKPALFFSEIDEVQIEEYVETPTNDQLFAAQLRDARQRAGLEIRQLAELLDWDDSYISKLESGNRVISEKTIQAYARAMYSTPEEVCPAFYEKKKDIEPQPANNVYIPETKPAIKQDRVNIKTPAEPPRRQNANIAYAKATQRERIMANELRQARIKYNWPQSKLAQRLKIHYTTFSNYELCKLNIREDFLQKLSKIMKVPAKKICPTFFKKATVIEKPAPKKAPIIEKPAPKKTAVIEKPNLPSLLLKSGKLNLRSLKSHRIAKGWSQRQVGEKIGLTNSAYSLLEIGRVKAKEKYIDRLLKIYGYAPREKAEVAPVLPKEPVKRGRKPIPIDKNVAPWLVYHRQRKAYVRSHVADAIGMSRANYSKVEQGEAPVHESHLYALSKFYNIERSELVKTTPPPIVMKQAGAEVLIKTDRHSLAVGATIEKLRKQRGYTQDQVVKLTKIPPGTYQSYISGRITLKGEHIFALSKLFGVPQSRFTKPDRIGNLMKRIRLTR